MSNMSMSNLKSSVEVISKILDRFWSGLTGKTSWPSVDRVLVVACPHLCILYNVLFPDESTIKKLRNWCEKGPPHITLRETSPLTQCAQSTHRRGTHRGLGNIIQALITLRKLSVSGLTWFKIVSNKMIRQIISLFSHDRCYKKYLSCYRRKTDT